MFKRRDQEFLQISKEIFERRHFNYKIFEYGSYNENDYLYSLQRSKAILWIGCHESQGFGLEEALSCNILMILLDATTMFDEISNNKIEYEYLRNIKPLLSTSAPYWDNQCGEKINNINDLESIVDTFILNIDKYSPRNFILNTLSHEKCFGDMLKKLELI